jgi:hypothetical protein
VGSIAEDAMLRIIFGIINARRIAADEARAAESERRLAIIVEAIQDQNRHEASLAAARDMLPAHQEARVRYMLRFLDEKEG